MKKILFLLFLVLGCTPKPKDKIKVQVKPDSIQAFYLYRLNYDFEYSSVDTINRKIVFYTAAEFDNCLCEIDSIHFGPTKKGLIPYSITLENLECTDWKGLYKTNEGDELELTFERLQENRDIEDAFSKVGRGLKLEIKQPNNVNLIYRNYNIEHLSQLL